MALLDGGSVFLHLVGRDGSGEMINLDKAINSPTEGQVFASWVNEGNPLTAQQKQNLLEILINTEPKTEKDKSNLQLVINHLKGDVTPSGDALSQQDIHDLLQDT